MNVKMNLAGVSFIAPPRDYNYAVREQWNTIISNSGHWFTRDTMRFWNGRIVWDSLTGIDQWRFGFIDSGVMWDGARRYTVRAWTLETGVSTLSELGQFATLSQARKWLRNAGWN